MERFSPGHRAPVGLPIVLLAVLAACSSGGGGGGCAAYETLAPGEFQGTKTDNAVNLRLSASGLDYLNNNWHSLVDLFAPGQQLTVPFPCAAFNVPLVGTLALGDQGGYGGDGRMDGICDDRDIPAEVNLTIEGFALLPRPPSGIYARLAFRLDTGSIYFANSCLQCSFRFNTGGNTAPGANAVNIVDASVLLKVDQRWDGRMTFELVEIDGIDVCGSGSQTDGRCLDPQDLDISGHNTCGGIVCGFASFIKDALVPYLSPIIVNMVTDMANKQAQAKCTSNSDCPYVPGQSAVCDDGVCVDATNDAPVPRLLGVEGRLKPGALLGAFGVSPEAEIDLSVAAGSSVKVDDGIMVGTRAGFETVRIGACTVGHPVPSYPAVASPQFDGVLPVGSDYHVGLSISQPFLSMAAYHAQQSGALCLGISGATFGILNTGMVKTFLPSLGKLVTRDGVDAPMMVALRPGAPPRVDVGEGTYDPLTKKPIDPLLTLVLDDLHMDFYTLLDERYVRLFTLSADVKLPLSLIFYGCDSLQPALGDLRQVITNIRTTRSEMLAEDPTLLTDLIPAVLGLAEPALASMLSPFKIPTFADYRLRVDHFRGITPASNGGFQHLGLFASLIPPGVSCGVAAPSVSAELVEGQVPEAAAMTLTGRGLPLPRAILRVGTPGSTAQAEYAYRVDDGLWTTFAPAENGLLEVEHPTFLLQGHHRIDVRARFADAPHGVSSHASVPFTVDFAPPEIELVPDAPNNRLRVRAFDNLSPEAELSFAYRVGEGAFSDFGPPRPIDLSAVHAAGGVTVRVRDGSGNVGEATWQDAQVHERPGFNGAVGQAADSAGGCNAGGAAPTSLALLMLGLWFGRRRA